MVNIDVRKLISFGKGSYIISMPKRWVDKNNLKKGDLISVNDEGYELILSVSQQSKKVEASEINIDAKDKSLELLKVEIVSSYLNGYDTINILFDSNYSEAQKIKAIMRDLSGMEIMEQTSTRIMAKNLININEISIPNIIRRMDIITRAMMEDAILCYRNQSTYESINHRDIDINRLYFLGYRVIKNALKNPRIAKSLNVETWQLHNNMLVILRLEKIADRQKRIARYLHTTSLDRETLTELDRIHTNISESYNEVMKSFYTNDKQTSFHIEVTNRDRTLSCDKLLAKYTTLHTSSKKKTTNSINLVAISKIIENLKAMAVEIRNMARIVLCYE